MTIPINLGLLLRQAEVKATRTLNEALADLNLTARHFGVLLLIHRDGVDTQKDLVARLITDKTAMVRIIDDLERSGCLTRTPSARDRRVSHLKLTSHGEKVFAGAHQRAQAAVNDLFGGLSSDQLAVLADALTQIVDGAVATMD
jgi:DNA-binding MarR family transcriptional regulator